MKTQQGAVLLLTLIFLLVMSILLNAMLMVSQLSHKSTQAAQQQLQLSASVWHRHLASARVPQTDERAELAPCPASYAAWSHQRLRCRIIRLDTADYSSNYTSYAAYSSLLLQQELAEE